MWCCVKTLKIVEEIEKNASISTNAVIAISSDAERSNINSKDFHCHEIDLSSVDSLFARYFDGLEAAPNYHKKHNGVTS